MYHGEDAAKAHAANAISQSRQGMVASGAIGIGAADLSPRAQRPAASIPNLMALAAETQKLAADRNYSVEALAGRALDIATRLAGSFPAPASNQDASRAGPAPFDDVASALDAVQQQVGAVRGPLIAMEPSLLRLSAALDAIERTLG